MSQKNIDYFLSRSDRNDFNDEKQTLLPILGNRIHNFNNVFQIYESPDFLWKHVIRKSELLMCLKNNLPFRNLGRNHFSFNMDFTVFLWFVKMGREFHPRHTLSRLEKHGRLDLLPFVSHFCPITDDVADLIRKTFSEDGYFQLVKNQSPL